MHSRKACAVVTCNSTEPRGPNYHSLISFSSTAQPTNYGRSTICSTANESRHLIEPASGTLTRPSLSLTMDMSIHIYGQCVGLIPLWCALHLSCVQSPSFLLWRLGLQLPRLQRPSQNSKRYIEIHVLLSRKAFKRLLLLVHKCPGADYCS